MGVATSALSVQNWYSDNLASACGSIDNTLSLNNLPSPTEGFLIIDPTNTSTREVIHYTGKTSNSITGVTRGVDGTTGQAHAQGVTVAMDYTSSHWLALQDGSAQTTVHAEVIKNPYKFSAYNNTSTTVAAGTGGAYGAWTKVAMQNKLFDTSSNFDNTTNYRFTAPIAGFYRFEAAFQVLVVNTVTAEGALYKNGTGGTLLKSTPQAINSSGGNNTIGNSLTALVQLSAGDYVEWYVRTNQSSTSNTTNTQDATYFEGCLESAT